MADTVQGSPAIKGEKLRNTVAASEYFKITWGISITPATLTTQRCRGGGCPFRKVGPNVYYAESDQDAHARQLIGEPVRSTSEYRQRQAELEAATS